MEVGSLIACSKLFGSLRSADNLLRFPAYSRTCHTPAGIWYRIQGALQRFPTRKYESLVPICGKEYILHLTGGPCRKHISFTDIFRDDQKRERGEKAVSWELSGRFIRWHADTGTVMRQVTGREETQTQHSTTHTAIHPSTLPKQQIQRPHMCAHKYTKTPYTQTESYITHPPNP